jgi:hypothetical protein
MTASAQPTSVQTPPAWRSSVLADEYPSTVLNLVFVRTPRGMPVLNLVLTMGSGEINLALALENLAFSGLNLALAKKNEV